MGESSRRLPQAARVADYDTDLNDEVPNTARFATRQSAFIGQPPKVVQRRAESDSGYSSHASVAGTAPAVQTLIATSNSTRRPLPASTLKSKPVVQWSEGQTSRPRAPSRSRSARCTDPCCDHRHCAIKGNPDRRYTLPARPDLAQQAATAEYYRQEAERARQTAQYAAYAQRAPPNVAASPTPLMIPTARSARPSSVYGYANVSGFPQQGPPPSPSAYQTLPAYYQQYQQYHQPSAGLYGSTPPNQDTALYPQTSQVATTPNAVQYTSAPTRLTRSYSTRDAALVLGNYVKSQPAAVQPPTRNSARQPAPMPGAFPGAESSETDSSSDYDSEAERRYTDQERRRRARDSQLMPPPSRRPSLSTRNTTTAAPRRASREAVPIRRNPRSDTDFDYPSSDQVDSDRTARAVVHRSTTDSSYSGRSRQPSVSTTGTKATTVSNRSGSGTRKYIIEDRHGRRQEYLSRNQYEELKRRSEQRKLEFDEERDRAERYQQKIRGQQVPELTAENIKQLSPRHTSNSHVSGHSRKSSNHSAGKDGGVRIESNGTILHVYGEATLEMRPGEDGKHAIIIDSGSGRDSAYHGSKSSGSRVSRRKDAIAEEDGYEKGY
ncbi:hypothetical protein LTR62_006452 [Meristemomyces frigidus]|uniref:Uncharacterized protein n=1 Tax=Meristemomyces frigidus TaxID=1508187 RepID=A0AAN7TG64_9PEZI|nr:hypothetical protein LTR62_006452 [Meristemomyces frigidus]